MAYLHQNTTGLPTKVAIVIPIYKAQPSEYEIISLLQCVNVLNKYPFIFVAPFSLDVSFYEEFCAKKVTFVFQRFEDRYFSGISGYNQLMLSTTFYHSFLTYEYILIYQLDAFVFRDELNNWCEKQYDYIGAPWPDFYRPESIYQSFSLSNFPIVRYLKSALLKIGSKNIAVGNGGFSLRKVSSFHRTCQFFKNIAQNWVFQEDEFFSIYVPAYWPFFRVASEKEACRFALEIKPEFFFERNHHLLPFGCHAWEKYNPYFWKPFIEKFGHQL